MLRSGPTRRDIGWSAVAQTFQYGSTLLALPILLHFLSAETFGAWSAFVLVAGFVQLLDFGVQPSLIRSLSFQFSLADRVKQDLALSARIEAGRRIYRWLSICILATQLTLGTLYLNSLSIEIDLPLVATWIGFSIGTTISFYASYITGVLQGLHEVASAQRAIALGRLFNLLILSVTVVCGAGLFGTAVGAIAGGSATFWLARSHLRAHKSKLADKTVNRMDLTQATVEIWDMAKPLGSVSIATFLILRSSALVAGAFLPLSVFAAYSLALQLMQTAVTFSRLHLNAAIPHLNSLASAKLLDQFRSFYRNANAKSWVIYAVISQTIVWGAPQVVYIINPGIPMLSHGTLMLLAGLYALEMMHGNACLGLTCLKIVPFVLAAWLTGLSILALSLVVSIVSPSNVALYIVAQIVCQLAYNAWKWPLTLQRALQK